MEKKPILEGPFWNPKKVSDSDALISGILAAYDFQETQPHPTSHPDDPSGLLPRASRDEDNPLVLLTNSHHLYPAPMPEDPKATEKEGRELQDSPTVSAFEQTVKKYTDMVLSLVEGMGERLSQLEVATQHLGNSFEGLRVSQRDNHREAEDRLRRLEDSIKEIQMGVLGLYDRKEMIQSQSACSRLPLLPPMNPSGQGGLPGFQLPQVPPIGPTNMPNESIKPPTQPIPFRYQSQHLGSSQAQAPPYYPQQSQPQVPLNRHSDTIGPPSSPSTSSYMSEPPSMPPYPLSGHYSGSQIQTQSQPQTQPQLQTQHEPKHRPQPQPGLGPHGLTVGGSGRVYEPSVGYSDSMPSGPPPPPYLPKAQLIHPYEPQSGSYGGLYRASWPAPSAPSSSGGHNSQPPTAQPLQHALPTSASGPPSLSLSGRGPVDEVIPKLVTMGFSREHVRRVAQQLMDNGQTVDFNNLLDKLTSGGGDQLPKSWYGH